MPVPGIGEVVAGCDLVRIIGDAVDAAGLSFLDGDIVCVTSKIVSKALGLRAPGTDRAAVVMTQSVRVVAERTTSTGVTRIVEGRHGVVMAAAGVDASNTGGTVDLLLLPDDPDAQADAVRLGLVSRLLARGGAAPRLGVILTDTAGRPWRAGQSDFALGAAGVEVLQDHRGSLDADGRRLHVTAMAVADEIAAAADLVKGKARGLPVAIVRGLGHLVAPEHRAADQHPAAPEHRTAPEHQSVPSRPDAAATGIAGWSRDPDTHGAARLLRTGPNDWFAMGHVEAARAALGVPPGSEVARAAGIRCVHAEPLADRVARALRVALGADESAPASGLRSAIHCAIDGGPAAAADTALDVTVRSADAYGLGRAVARVEVALWSEDLTVTGTQRRTDHIVLSVAPAH